MSGIIVKDGKNHIAEIIFGSTPLQNYWLGLMTNGDITKDEVTDYDIQLGSGLTEVTGTDYGRIELTRNSDWAIVAGLATSNEKTFTVGAGGWDNVKGWFLAESESGNDVVWAESFPVGQQSNKAATSLVKIIAKITQKAEDEA